MSGRPRLTLSVWWLLTVVSCVQLAVAGALRAWSLPAVRAMSIRGARLVAWTLAGGAGRVVWAIEATGRRLGGCSTCLVRAITAEALLCSSSRALRFSIGVRRDGDGLLQAHAWVADGDRVLIGGQPDGYVDLLTHG